MCLVVLALLLCLPCCLLLLQMRVEEPQRLALAAPAAPARQQPAVPALAAMLPWNK
jgi:hypothetical protein